MVEVTEALAELVCIPTFRDRYPRAINRWVHDCRQLQERAGARPKTRKPRTVKAHVGIGTRPGGDFPLAVERIEGA